MRELCAGADRAQQQALQSRLQGWRPEFVGTLLFVVEPPRVLLIEKLTGHGAGKVNAPGGKLEPGETPLACAQRETFEEVGIRPLRPRMVATLRFVDTQWPQWLGYAFVAEEYAGIPTESREAKPFWCELGELPFARMWPDDEIWLPYVLPVPGASQLARAEQLSGDFLFAAGKLLAHRCYVETSPCE